VKLFVVAAVIAAGLQTRSDAPSQPESLLGTWRGESRCVDRVAAPACKDEAVAYEFTAGGTPGIVHWKADKIVDGKREEMGELDLAYDAADKCWKAESTSPSTRIVWCVVNPDGAQLSGTGRMFPDDKVVRDVFAFRTSGPGVIDIRTFPSRESGFGIEGPWVFNGRVQPADPLRSWRSNYGMPAERMMPIHLDDGSLGAMIPEPRPCGTAKTCKYPDSDHYWIKSVDAKGREIAHIVLEAAYATFEVVPVDLVGGPGDELMIFYNRGHSSPPTGYDLQIWSAGRAGARRISNIERASHSLNTLPFACAFQRRLFTVDRADVKPRPITIRPMIGADPMCTLPLEGQTETEEMRRSSVLEFHNGKYTLR